ncbi:MAG: type II toxin-antitoxin system VapC family toxin [Actinomycetota bacterium]|nr:type II toxin-antitoxin system VapC family toxin [Actinomycetota bacterium]
MIVLDASAAVAVLLNVGLESRRVRKRISQPGETLHVPHLFEIEVLSALRRHSLSGVLPATRARLALDRLREIRLIRYPHTPLLGRIWELRDNLTAYDAAYVALAEALDAPLVTLDERLAQASNNRATIELHR